MAGQPFSHSLLGCASARLASLCGGILCAMVATFVAPVHAVEPSVDLRVLIDVSGSMKDNDPKNLRSPALRLLVGLLPDGASSGVWTFGRYVNMQVPLARVDDAWRTQARRAAEGIHSRGAKTNIEEALRRATADWPHPAGAHEQRIVLLLTDGVVDMGSGERDSAASRDRIVESIVPKLRQGGVIVHTVALSGDADHELLGTLSAETGGWYERVDNASALSRTFLRLFEQSVPATTLPIRESRFRVDGGVSDMTVLVFRAGDGTEPVLRGPDSVRWTLARHPTGVQWFRESDYDMVTVASPRPGEWVIEGTSDPDNRVQVVTNLRLALNALPDQLLWGEPLIAEAQLVAEKGVQVPQAVLAVTDFRLQVSRPNELPRLLALADSGSGGDAHGGDRVYSGQFDSAGLDGIYDLIVEASSPTFERQQRRRLEVFRTPIDIQFEAPSEVPGQWNVHVRIVPVLVPHESVVVELDYVGVVGGASQTLEAVAPGVWSHSFTPPPVASSVTVSAAAKRRDGRPLQISAQQGLASPQARPLPKTSTTAEAHEQADGGVQWPIIMASIALINLLLASAGGAAVWYWRHRAIRAQPDVELEAEA